MTIEKAHELIDKLYQVAKSLDEIEDPVSYALRETLRIAAPKRIYTNTLKNFEIVKEWRRNNPEGRKWQCFQDTGLSRPTIDKYWNEVEE